MSPTKIWLIVAVVCLIIELLPPATHFLFLCFTLGALAAAIAAFFTPVPWVPWVVFAVTSVAFTPLLIPLAKFLFTPKPTASNFDEIIGEKAKALEEITTQKAGLVKVRGETWRALPEGGPIAKDALVEILKIDGTHVIVRKVS